MAKYQYPGLLGGTRESDIDRLFEYEGRVRDRYRRRFTRDAPETMSRARIRRVVKKEGGHLPKFLAQEVARQGLSPSVVTVTPIMDSNAAGSWHPWGVRTTLDPRHLGRRTQALAILRHELGHHTSHTRNHLIPSKGLAARWKKRGLTNLQMREAMAEIEHVKNSPNFRAPWRHQQHVFTSYQPPNTGWTIPGGKNKPTMSQGMKDWVKTYTSIRRYGRFLRHLDAKAKAGTLQTPWKKMWETRRRLYGPKGRSR